MPTFLANPERCYIIVGGLGGFGLELADWLFLKGARKIILSSHSGLTTGYQAYRIRSWRSYGVTIKLFTKDLTAKENCTDLIQEAKALGPIDAVFNLAVVLNDASFSDQTESTFNNALRPKAFITSRLDDITRNECPDLRYFVVFSSQAGARGNASQTNYGMANSIIERICEKRKLDGLPALAIQWGPVGDVGIVANMQKGNTELAIFGTQQQNISNCLEVLDTFLQQGNPIVSSFVVASNRRKISSIDNITSVIAAVIGIKNIKHIDPHRTLTELGMDSMTAAEIAHILKADIGLSLTREQLRTLTFAKMNELEFVRKDVKMPTRKPDVFRNFSKDTSVTNGILMMSLPERTTAMIKNLPSKIKDDTRSKTLFILPGFDGSLKMCEPLAHSLSAHVKGILYNFSNCEETIMDTAGSILPFIEAHISRTEPFIIMGHLYGAVVGLEIVALLEAKGYIGTYVAIEGSPVYMKTWLEANSFSTDRKKLELFIICSALSTVLPKEKVKTYMDQISDRKKFDVNVEKLVDLMPADIDREYFKESVNVAYKRTIALINYKFNHNKLKSKVYLFKAKRAMVTGLKDDYSLSQICEGFIQNTVIEEDYLRIISHKKLLEDLENQLEQF